MFDWWIQPRSPAVSQEKRCRVRSKPSRVSASAIVTITYIGPATTPHASSARVAGVGFAIVPPSVRRRDRQVPQLVRIAHYVHRPNHAVLDLDRRRLHRSPGRIHDDAGQAVDDPDAQPEVRAPPLTRVWA